MEAREQPQKHPRTIKKYDFKKLFKLVVKELEGSTITTAESIAKRLRTKPHYVTQVFHKLNLLGIMGRGYNTTDWDGDWYATRYSVYPEKIKQLLTGKSKKRR